MIPFSELALESELEMEHGHLRSRARDGNFAVPVMTDLTWSLRHMRWNWQETYPSPETIPHMI